MLTIIFALNSIAFALPQQLSQRLAEVEYHGIVAGVNSVLQTFSGFSVLALLLPFVVFDSAVLIALILFDPSLILAPWDYGMLELLLPLGLEFGVIFGSFPLVAHLLSMRAGSSSLIILGR